MKSRGKGSRREARRPVKRFLQGPRPKLIVARLMEAMEVVRDGLWEGDVEQRFFLAQVTG